jgi:hypothetical protein
VECTGPRAGAVERGWTVTGSDVVAPPNPGPVWMTRDLWALASQQGQPLTAVRIPALPVLDTVDGTELLPVVKSDVSYRATLGQVAAGVAAGVTAQALAYAQVASDHYVDLEFWMTTGANTSGITALGVDDRRLLQAAWDNIAATNQAQQGKVWLKLGNYALTINSTVPTGEWPTGPGSDASRKNLRWRSGLRMQCNGTRFYFPFQSGGLFAKVCCEDAATCVPPAELSAGQVFSRPSDIVWEGGTLTAGQESQLSGSQQSGAFAGDYGGPLVGGWVDNLTLRRQVIDGYGGVTAGGLAYSILGDNMEVAFCEAWRPGRLLGNGFFRLLGGSNVRVHHSRGVSGDGGYQVAPAVTGAYGNRSFFDCRFTDSHVDCPSAPLILAEVVTRDDLGQGAGALSCTASHLLWHNISGKSGGYGVIIANGDSTGLWNHITLDNVEIDNTGNTQYASALEISGDYGGMEDVLLNNVRVKSPFKYGTRARGLVRRLTLRDVHTELARDTNSGNGWAAAFVQGVTDLRIEGGSGESLGDTLQIGSTSTAVTPSTTARPVVVGYKAKGVRNGQYAVKLLNAISPRVAGIAPERVSGATTAGGVYLDANTTDGRVSGDFTQVDTSVRDAAVRTMISAEAVFSSSNAPADASVSNQALAATLAWTPGVAMIRVTAGTGPLLALSGTPTGAVPLTIVAAGTSFSVTQGSGGNGGSFFGMDADANLAANQAMHCVYNPVSALWQVTGFSSLDEYVVAGGINQQAPAGNTVAWTVGTREIRVTGTPTITTISGTPAGAQELTLRRAATGSFTAATGGNMVGLPAASLAIAQNETLELLYDPTSAVWAVVLPAQSIVQAMLGTALAALPTTDPGAGKPWNSGGVVQISQ